MNDDITDLVCHKEGCEATPTHLLLLLNIKTYIVCCPTHRMRASHTSEAVIGVDTVMYYQPNKEESIGSERV